MISAVSANVCAVNRLSLNSNPKKTIVRCAALCPFEKDIYIYIYIYAVSCTALYPSESEGGREMNSFFAEKKNNNISSQQSVELFSMLDRINKYITAVCAAE